MAFFGKSQLKISKKESVDTGPYTVYYPHTIPETERKWTAGYHQIVSIDPAQKNYAFRIERRYANGWIVPIVFDKVEVASYVDVQGVTCCNTFQVLTLFLDKYQDYYKDCHFIVIERQLPQNYKATRIAQHTISYFSLKLHNSSLLPAIIEVSPKLKGKMLGAPKGTNDRQLKDWATKTARELLVLRQDTFSLNVLNHHAKKQDDLSDTVCQLEALFIFWGFPPTSAPPASHCSVPLPPKGPVLVVSEPDILLQVGPIETREITSDMAQLRLRAGYIEISDDEFEEGAASSE
jgi:hypothetical protein